MHVTETIILRKNKIKGGAETNLFSDLPHTVHKLKENWRALVIRMILVAVPIPL